MFVWMRMLCQVIHFWLFFWMRWSSRTGARGLLMRLLLRLAWSVSKNVQLTLDSVTCFIYIFYYASRPRTERELSALGTPFSCVQGHACWGSGTANLLSNLNDILDRSGLETMRSKLSQLQKFATQLAGIYSVLEVMVSSFTDAVSAHVNDLHQLIENTLKAKQVFLS